MKIQIYGIEALCSVYPTITAGAEPKFYQVAEANSKHWYELEGEYDIGFIAHLANLLKEEGRTVYTTTDHILRIW